MRLVVEAVVAAKLVEVALVEVEFKAVKFCKVLEPLTRRLAKVPRPVEVRLPPLAVLKKRLVEEAVVAKKEVEVALVEVEKVAKVVEAIKPRGLPLSQRPVEVALTIWPA